MGEHQCPHCGHITTGFEDQDFKLMREAEEAKDAEIARLRAVLQKIASLDLTKGAAANAAEAALQNL